MTHVTDTVWNRIFMDNDTLFREAHPAMAGLTAIFRQSKMKDILDLGSGRGRHMIYLARKGFLPCGLDNAIHGLKQTRQMLAGEGLDGRLALGDIYEPLPYADASFDAVISFQVIHHARLKSVQGCVGEIWRVLRPGGLVYITVPAQPKNKGKHPSEEIEPNTFVPCEGMEKGLPHHHFTSAGLRETFHNFTLHGVLMGEPHHLALFAEKA